jgi:tellurite methyltransferase
MADWNQVYQEKTVAQSTPARVLLDNRHLLPSSGKALDYASGLSGSGVFLAQQGFDVTAWDLSDIAVDKINAYANKKKLSLHAQKMDLEKTADALQGEFDVIVVSFFLHRESLPILYKLLKPCGLLFYQTFSGEQLNGVGPSRRAFRLRRGELLEVFSSMKLLSYREDYAFSGSNNAIADQVFFVAQK